MRAPSSSLFTYKKWHEYESKAAEAEDLNSRRFIVLEEPERRDAC